jgi:hypothetical protein
MNERIKELLTRPGLERLTDWASIGPVQRAALEECIELVIAECAVVVDSYWHLTGAQLKEHFGDEP